MSVVRNATILCSHYLILPRPTPSGIFWNDPTWTRPAFSLPDTTLLSRHMYCRNSEEFISELISDQYSASIKHLLCKKICLWKFIIEFCTLIESTLEWPLSLPLIPGPSETNHIAYYIFIGSSIGSLRFSKYHSERTTCQYCVNRRQAVSLEGLLLDTNWILAGRAG